MAPIRRQLSAGTRPCAMNQDSLRVSGRYVRDDVGRVDDAGAIDVRGDGVRHGQPGRVQLAQQPPLAKRARALARRARGSDRRRTARRGRRADSGAAPRFRRRAATMSTAPRPDVSIATAPARRHSSASNQPAIGGLGAIRGDEHERAARRATSFSSACLSGSRAALRRAARSTARSTVAGVEVVEAAQVLERALAREARAALDAEIDDRPPHR